MHVGPVSASQLFRLFLNFACHQETDASDIMLEGFRWSIGDLLGNALPELITHAIPCSTFGVEWSKQCVKHFQGAFRTETVMGGPT